MGELRMTGDTPQRIRPDMTLSDVPVAVDTRVVFSSRIVEMDCPDLLCSHLAIKCLDRCFESLCRADVVTGGEGMSRIEANAKGQAGTGLHDFSQVLKTMTNALTLTGSVFQKNPKRTQIESVRCAFQTLRTHLDPVSLTRSARAARMNYEVVCAEKNPALQLFSKGRARLLQHRLIRCRKIDQIVSMNGYGRDLCLASNALEQLDFFIA